MKLKKIKNNSNKGFDFFFGCIFAILLLVIFDLFFYFLNPNPIKKFSYFYQNNLADHSSKNFPKNYYINNKSRGFDIKPEFKLIKFQLPSEIGYKYPIYSNSLGCFDNDDFTIKENKKIIYLAGDSFTWAYVPNENKFGTILNGNLNSNYEVLNCGVPHTGQLHQFNKFKEIYDVHKNIELVIVNLVANDVDNDFFFPHTKVINGNLVEDSFWCMKDGKINVIRKEFVSLQKNLDETKILNLTLKISATSNIAYFTVRKIAKYFMYNTNLSRKIKCPILSQNIYGFKDWEYIKDDKFAFPNIKAIEDWIKHSKKNNYQIIFSIIPHKDKTVKHFEKLENFLEFIGAEFYNFEKYIRDNNYAKKDLYWNNDGHFNLRGNEIYSNFLLEKIKF